jgi:hypothetical protein
MKPAASGARNAIARITKRVADADCIGGGR